MVRIYQISQKCQILALRSEKVCISKIARRIRRGRPCLSKFPSNPKKHGKNKRTNKKKIFSNHEKRQILVEVNKGTPGSGKIRSNLKLEKISTGTIQRVLRNHDHLKFTKRKFKLYANDRLK